MCPFDNGKHISQEENVLNHLRTRGPLTPLDALNLYGSFRLAAIIFNLRKGHLIKTRDTTDNGTGKHYATYIYERPLEQCDYLF